MIRFTRHEPNEEGTYETLTLVRLDSDDSLAIQIETGTPNSWQKNPNDRTFVGLYDLDGDQIQTGNETWEIAEDSEFYGNDEATLAEAAGLNRRDVDVPLAAKDALAGLMRSWESGNSVCEEV